VTRHFQIDRHRIYLISRRDPETRLSAFIRTKTDEKRGFREVQTETVEVSISIIRRGNDPKHLKSTFEVGSSRIRLSALDLRGSPWSSLEKFLATRWTRRKDARIFSYIYRRTIANQRGTERPALQGRGEFDEAEDRLPRRISTTWTESRTT